MFQSERPESPCRDGACPVSDSGDQTASKNPKTKEIQRSEVIADFLKRAYAEIHPTGVLLSLDVFGVMAWQRSVDLSHTGQDIVAMSKHCDVLSPMIYPSHFFGMDGIARPGDAPEHFIGESMDRFKLITKGSEVVIRPWLKLSPGARKPIRRSMLKSRSRSQNKRAASASSSGTPTTITQNPTPQCPKCVRPKASISAAMKLA